jgi:hypothetical protein
MVTLKIIQHVFSIFQHRSDNIPYTKRVLAYSTRRNGEEILETLICNEKQLQLEQKKK